MKQHITSEAVYAILMVSILLIGVYHRPELGVHPVRKLLYWVPVIAVESVLFVFGLKHLNHTPVNDLNGEQ